MIKIGRQLQKNERYAKKNLSSIIAESQQVTSKVHKSRSDDINILFIDLEITTEVNMEAEQLECAP